MTAECLPLVTERPVPGCSVKELNNPSHMQKLIQKLINHMFTKSYLKDSYFSFS